MKRRQIFLIILVVIFSAGLFFSPGIIVKCQRYLRAQALLKKRKAAWLNLRKALQYRISHFKGRVGLVVKDLDTGWEITFNEGELMPSASLVKVPIMLSYLYAERDNKISLKETLCLKSSDKVAGSKVLGREPVGAVFTLEELFDPMITQSDNAAANMLIGYLGFDTLNAYFRQMGLKNTNISRKMMDFKEREGGVENYSTAKDMAYLLEQLYYNKFINKDASQKCLELLGEQKINDRIPRNLPKGTPVLHKTGLEKHVCHDAGIVFTDKGNFLICVLAQHEDKTSGRAKKFISDVTLSAYNYYQDF